MLPDLHPPHSLPPSATIPLRGPRDLLLLRKLKPRPGSLSSLRHHVHTAACIPSLLSSGYKKDVPFLVEACPPWHPRAPPPPCPLNNVPTDRQGPNLEPLSVTLQNNRDLASVIKLRILRWGGRFFWNIEVGPTRDHRRGRGKFDYREADDVTRAETGLEMLPCWLCGWRRDNKPRKPFQKPGKARNRGSPRASRGPLALLKCDISPRIWTSDLQTVPGGMCVILCPRVGGVWSELLTCSGLFASSHFVSCIPHQPLPLC